MTDAEMLALVALINTDATYCAAMNTRAHITGNPEQITFPNLELRDKLETELVRRGRL